MTKYHGITINDLNDIPEELFEQLKISKSFELSWKLIGVINKCGGSAQIDKILVEYYKKHGEILNRVKLNAKLWRMSQKGLIECDPKIKGLYKTNKTSSEVNE